MPLKRLIHAICSHEDGSGISSVTPLVPYIGLGDSLGTHGSQKTFRFKRSLPTSWHSAATPKASGFLASFLCGYDGSKTAGSQKP